MKKILTAFWIIVICCSVVSCKESKTERVESGELVNPEEEKKMKENKVLYKRFYYDYYDPRYFQNDKNQEHGMTRYYFVERGMDYIVYKYSEYMEVVNLTKDSLEVELLTKQLQD
jgi:hypothetical protein